MKKPNKFLGVQDVATEEMIVCSKCGRASVVFKGKKVVAKLTLTAVREAPEYNPISGKSSKGKVTDYICTECAEKHRGKHK